MTTTHTAERTTTTYGIDPLKQNVLTALVASGRALQDDLTPAQQAIRDRGRARVDALMASGLYNL